MMGLSDGDPRRLDICDFRGNREDHSWVRAGERDKFSMIRNQINRTGVQALLIDASVALTFLSIAETTSRRERRERNIRNARRAYESIHRLRPMYALTRTEDELLDARVQEMTLRLAALGEKFKSPDAVPTNSLRTQT